MKYLSHGVKMLEMRIHFLLACQLGILGILVAWNNIGGIAYGMYESAWYWDIVSHMLGGLWVGLFTAWAASYFKMRVTIMQCVLAAFAVGVAWEIFEYVEQTGVSVFMSYTADTIKDLCDDVIGGFIAGYFVNRFRR